MLTASACRALTGNAPHRCSSATTQVSAGRLPLRRSCRAISLPTCCSDKRQAAREKRQKRKNKAETKGQPRQQKQKQQPPPPAPPAPPPPSAPESLFEASQQARSQRQRSVVVVGGGWAGFSAAWQLLKQGFAVTLLDASPNPGGLSSGCVRNQPANQPRRQLVASYDTRA